MAFLSCASLNRPPAREAVWVGVCVLANESVPISVTPLFLGFGIAFGIAITVVLILWGFGKISNRELPEESN